VTPADAVAAGWRFASLVWDEAALHYAFVAPDRDAPVILDVPAAASVPSIALAAPAAAWAEREVHELHGVTFAGSPDDRPIVRHQDGYPFRVVDGEGVMEVRVGPIHAGVIEPGHFRFSTVGETVLGLEVRLFYVHRGVERRAEGMTVPAAIVLGERVSGTSSVAHALALARAAEAAARVDIAGGHAALRTLLLELERVQNHCADLANLCAGTALAGLQAEGLVIKERFLRACDALTGSRWLRNLVGAGGARRVPARADVDAALAAARDTLAATDRLADKFFGSASNVERLTGTGVLSAEHVRALGCVGVVARASGVPTDSRAELRFPSAVDRELHAGFAPVVGETRDVAARARVRLDEARVALALAHAAAERAADGAGAAFPADATGAAWGWAESARGEVLTYVRLDRGRIARLRVRSPSRMNWPAIEHAMPGNIVPDFPLINKSFNLSYAGCDL
jgi:Ni,Fe-hydrogenase III large subunit